MCHVTLGNGGVQKGTCPKRGASPYVLQRSRSQHSLVTVQHSGYLSRICAWFVRFSHCSISFLLAPFLSPHGCLPTTPGHMAESPYFMAPSSWLPSQRSRHSSFLTTGSMTDSLFFPAGMDASLREPEVAPLSLQTACWNLSWLSHHLPLF